MEAWLHNKLCYTAAQCKVATGDRLRTFLTDLEFFKSFFKLLTGRDFVDKEIA